MKKVTILKAILALGVSHTIVCAMDTAESNLELSWCDLYANAIVDPLKNKQIDIYKDLILPTEDNNPSSGLNVLVEGSQKMGTLAHEILEGNHNRLLQLCKLASIPYCAEKGSNELEKKDVARLSALQDFKAALSRCKISYEEMIESDFSDLLNQKKIVLEKLFVLYKNRGILSIITDVGSDFKMSMVKGYHGNINEHLNTVDPLNLLKNKLNSLCEEFDRKDFNELTFNDWIEDVSEQAEELIQSYDYKFWHTEIQNTIEKSQLVRGLNLKVLGTMSRNETDKGGQFSTVIATNSDYSKIYVLSAGTKSKQDWLWNNLNAPLTDRQLEKEALIGHNIHRGFYDAALGDDRFIRLIKDILIKNHLEGKSCPEFYCIGHSLGGAIATILGLVVRETMEIFYEENQSQVDLKNLVKIFGVAAAMPLQKNDKLQGAIDKINLTNMIYVDNWNDPVPIAAQHVGYATVGTHLVIPSTIGKALEYGEIPGLHHHLMKNYINKVEEFYGHLKSGISDAIELQRQFESHPFNVRLTESFFEKNPVNHQDDANKIVSVEDNLGEIQNYIDNPDQGSLALKLFGVGASVLSGLGTILTAPITVPVAIYNYATSNNGENTENTTIEGEKK